MTVKQVWLTKVVAELIIGFFNVPSSTVIGLPIHLRLLSPIRNALGAREPAPPAEGRKNFERGE